VTINCVGLGAGRQDLVARHRVLPGRPRVDRLDHKRIERPDPVLRVAEDDIPRGAALVVFARELGPVFKALGEVLRVAGDILPGDADEPGEEDEAFVADVRV
jgi:hypothetical protein